ncbi:MAG: tRNA (N(6)-L-threonylcarbamoyladenosine(37)-C(2))-methylthiotransferase MtaB [Bacteroidales bacterium]|nr:tRNA (N(6)-L-threonylcarbamoyladenosine(37)-C(2))-methylthiotransferase MtaB [Bacteroidales bacterium]
MKIAFITLGCKLNYAETSTYERGFIKAGLEVVPWREKADIYLVNTCSVTAVSDAKSRSEIRKLHRINPAAVIVVTGCSAQLRRPEIEGIEGVVRVFGATEKSLVVPETLALASLPCRHLPDGGKGVFAAYSSGERTRSFLKVQDGCDNFCAYCTVPYARGHSRNIPISEAVALAREIADKGIKEIVLTGVNTGDFGRSTGESFLDLLKALNDVEGIERYRISSIEPNLISEEIIDWIATGTKFLPHFHIPLQTGCDRLLSTMGRRYDTAFFERKIDYIRRAMEAPGRLKVFFGIDTMVGLPGESEEMFAETCAFIEKIHPAFIHVFPYSRRPGTPAAQMPGQVSEETKHERVKRLEELCSRLHEGFIADNRGLRARVLFESREKDGTMSGYTENYIRITRPWDPEKAGTIVEETI